MLNSNKSKGDCVLTSLITEYHRVNQEIKRLELEKKRLKSEIDLKLSSMGESRYEDSQYSAVMSQSQRVKYDLNGLSQLLNQLGIDEDDFSERTVDLKKVEKLVAQGLIDPVEISNYAKVTQIKTLTVKKEE